MIKSVYIHIPFCNDICTYCDFCKFYYDKDKVKKYLEALQEEIKARYQGETIKTLYIGGGTPSALTYQELEKLFEIIKIFKLSKNYEFTVEVNPESLTLAKIKLFKENKVNRISIGVQSTSPLYLKYLGRGHTFLEVKEKIALLHENGFHNINVDLIYGMEKETLKDLENDLTNLLSLEVSHISTYSLMIEEHTKLYLANTKSISEDLDYEMYDLIRKRLQEAGFVHYEISNFAKKGYESLHNLGYWDNDYYYGFGVSAASYLPNIRFKNTSSLSKYLKKDYISEKETLTEKDVISYALILGFRKIKGINKQEFKEKYKCDILDLYNIKDLIKMKKIVDSGSNIYISYDKIYVENDILINFVGE